MMQVFLNIFDKKNCFFCQSIKNYHYIYNFHHPLSSKIMDVEDKKISAKLTFYIIPVKNSPAESRN